MSKSINIPIKDLLNLLNNDLDTVKKYKDYLKSLKRKCALCDKEFIPNGRIETKYCKNCIEGGAQKAYKIKVENDEALKNYNREYQRRYAKIRYLKGEERDKSLTELRKFTCDFRKSFQKDGK